MSLAETVKDVVLPIVEVQAKKLVEEKFDGSFDQAVKDLQDKIPSDQLDQVIALLAAHFKPQLKAGLLEAVSKISDKV